MLNREHFASLIRETAGWAFELGSLALFALMVGVWAVGIGG